MHISSTKAFKAIIPAALLSVAGIVLTGEDRAGS